MTYTLSLVDQLLARARTCQETGRLADALTHLTRLASFVDLPAPVAEEVQARLGELHLKRRHFRKARRHLLAALAFHPDSARYHRLLGLALVNDPHGELGRAWRHYRRALALAPRRPRWRSEAGLLALRLGRLDQGLGLLREAHTQAPDDPIILGRLVKGLCMSGLVEEAECVVRLARFRAPRSGAVAQLWFDLKLDGLRRRQETAAAEERAAAEPVILPFCAAPTGEKEAARYDGAHALPGPHLVRLRARRFSRRAP
jgi:Flp pilus assembly protein TadD